MSDPAGSRPPRIVWVVSDGKPGHLNQSLGLAEALARQCDCAIHVLPALSRISALACALRKRLPGTLPAPDLLIGAGHATHLGLLALRRASGAPAVVLMRPSLPRRWFDYAVIPEHDVPPPDARTFISVGALNRVRPVAAIHDRAPHGLILIGGESKHFIWDNAAIAVQIRDLVTRTPEMRWMLTTSRRTPDSFLAQLETFGNLDIAPHTQTPADWLPQRLAASRVVWVSPDSVSMVTEALTAGADVGVFDLPANPKSRVGRAVAHLADAQRITHFATWRAHEHLHPNQTPLAEAERCAVWILECLKKN